MATSSREKSSRKLKKEQLERRRGDERGRNRVGPRGTLTVLTYLTSDHVKSRVNQQSTYIVYSSAVCVLKYANKKDIKEETLLLYQVICSDITFRHPYNLRLQMEE